MPRRSSAASGRVPKAASSSRPVVNLVLLSVSLGAFVKLSIARGWIDWPPSQIGPILASLAGWVALCGPWILFRHEENSDGMGGGDRVWITCGLALWIALALGLMQGNLPRLQSIASAVNARDLAVIAAATLLGGLLARPTGTRWTWTNLTGWFLAACWMAAAVLPAGNPLWPLVALGGR